MVFGEQGITKIHIASFSQCVKNSEEVSWLHYPQYLSRQNVSPNWGGRAKNHNSFSSVPFQLASVCCWVVVHCAQRG